VAIAALGAAAGALPTQPVKPTVPTAPTGGAGDGFGGTVGKALDDLQTTHTQADQLATKAATGDLQDAAEFMIASTQASLATELTVAVRNRAVESFTSIMQMGI
jgi:flagellar hook-basal body complex protein FliE